MPTTAQNLIWIDLEMTGLDVNRDVIIEIATIVTDGDLNILAEGPCLAISQPEDKLNDMDEWNTNQHGKSGLIDDVRDSAISCQQAEQQTIDFLRQHVAAGVSPMCGNSICMDRRYLHNYMPELEQYFHYRNLDVSTVKELARRWHPAIFKVLNKSGEHRALSDIKESIEELKYYRSKFFILP